MSKLAEDLVIVGDSQAPEINNVAPDEIVEKIRTFKKAQLKSFLDNDEELGTKFKESKLDPLTFLDKQELTEEEKKRIKTKNPQLMEELQKNEKDFYKKLHESHSFQDITWATNADNNLKTSTIQINGQDVHIKETKQQTADGIIFRNVELDIEKPLPGKLDLSLAVMDKQGNRIPADKAVYFTAHYDKAGKLVEMSMPKPIKFTSEAKDSPIIIEHEGQEYTLPINRGQYERMQETISKNKSLQTELTQDLTLEQEQARAQELGDKLAQVRAKRQEMEATLQEETLDLTARETKLAQTQNAMEAFFAKQKEERATELAKVAELKVAKKTISKTEEIITAEAAKKQAASSHKKSSSKSEFEFSPLMPESTRKELESLTSKQNAPQSSPEPAAVVQTMQKISPVILNASSELTPEIRGNLMSQLTKEIRAQGGKTSGR